MLSFRRACRSLVAAPHHRCPGNTASFFRRTNRRDPTPANPRGDHLTPSGGRASFFVIRYCRDIKRWFPLILDSSPPRHVRQRRRRQAAIVACAVIAQPEAAVRCPVRVCVCVCVQQCVPCPGKPARKFRSAIPRVGVAFGVLPACVHTVAPTDLPSSEFRIDGSGPNRRKSCRSRRLVERTEISLSGSADEPVGWRTARRVALERLKRRRVPGLSNNTNGKIPSPDRYQLAAAAVQSLANARVPPICAKLCVIPHESRVHAVVRKQKTENIVNARRGAQLDHPSR